MKLTPDAIGWSVHGKGRLVFEDGLGLKLVAEVESGDLLTITRGTTSYSARIKKPCGCIIVVVTQKTGDLLTAEATSVDRRCPTHEFLDLLEESFK